MSTKTHCCVLYVLSETATVLKKGEEGGREEELRHYID